MVDVQLRTSARANISHTRNTYAGPTSLYRHHLLTRTCAHATSLTRSPSQSLTHSHAHATRGKQKSKRREAEIQAEIALLNLPPPPSAIEEEHPDLLVDSREEKKKGLFQKMKDLKDNVKRYETPQTSFSLFLCVHVYDMRRSSHSRKYRLAEAVIE